MTEILSDHSRAPSLKVTASLRTLNEQGECVLSAQFPPDESTIRSQSVTERLKPKSRIYHKLSHW